MSSFLFAVRRCRCSRVLESAFQPPSRLATTTTTRTRVVVRSLSSSSSSSSSSAPESVTSLSGETTAESVTDKVDESENVLNKKDLAKILSQKHGIKAAMANNILTTVFGTMAEYVADGKAVKIVRFGTLELQPCQARMARNPKTNAIVHVPKMNRIRFRPSDFFKGLVLNPPKPPPPSS